MLYLCVCYHDGIEKTKCLAPIRHAQSYSNVHKSLPLERLSLLSAGPSCFALLHFFHFCLFKAPAAVVDIFPLFNFSFLHLFIYLFIQIFLFFYYCQIIKFYLYLYSVVVRMYGFSMVAEGETDKLIF